MSYEGGAVNLDFIKNFDFRSNAYMAIWGIFICFVLVTVHCYKVYMRAMGRRGFNGGKLRFETDQSERGADGFLGSIDGPEFYGVGDYQVHVPKHHNSMRNESFDDDGFDDEQFEDEGFADE